MVVGVLRLEFAIPEARSLKDRRRAVRSFKDRVSHRHNVSVAEIEDVEKHQRAVVAVAMVSNDRRFADSCLCKIADEARLARGLVLMDQGIEWL